MASYTDANQISWRVEIDGFIMRRIKQEVGFDICDLVGKEASLSTLLMDVSKTIDVLWICCEEQAVTLKIDEIGFAKGLRGDALGNATDALLDAVVDFFPTMEQRTAAKTVLQTARKAGQNLLQQATKVLQNLDLQDVKSMQCTGSMQE